MPLRADASYRRVLLKMSGEALMGEREFGLDPAMVAQRRRRGRRRARAWASRSAW